MTEDAEDDGSSVFFELVDIRSFLRSRPILPPHPDSTMLRTRVLHAPVPSAELLARVRRPSYLKKLRTPEELVPLCTSRAGSAKVPELIPGRS